MNSEISNILKLSPVTIVKAEKSTDERLLSTAKKQDEVSKQDAESVLSKLAPDAKASIKSLQQDEAKKSEKPSADLVKKAAEQGNELLQSVNRSLQFKVDDSTKELVVKIVDNQSGEVVRQIPSEEMLDFIKRMQELDGSQGSVLQDRA